MAATAPAVVPIVLRYRSVRLAAHDLSLSTSDGKRLLTSVSLIAKPGEVLVISGPAGAGKTALLNALALKTHGRRQTGSIILNGALATPAAMRQLSGLVSPQARLLPYLTVYESLMFIADMKLRNLTRNERRNRVENTIARLELQGCRNTIVGGEWKKGISSGERKRLCVAMEILSRPAILFLDDPTNGLDSFTACELLATLREVAKDGCTVICTIQQPNSKVVRQPQCRNPRPGPLQMWAYIDQLLLVLQGSVVYAGNAAEGKNYLSRVTVSKPYGFECPKHYTAVDHFFAIVSARVPSAVELPTVEDQRTTISDRGSASKWLTAAYDSSNEKAALLAEIAGMRQPCSANRSPGSRRPPLPGGYLAAEIPALVWRALLNSLRNPIVCCVMLLVQMIQGVILGGMFWHRGMMSFASTTTTTLADSHNAPSSLTAGPTMKTWEGLFVNGLPSSPQYYQDGRFPPQNSNSPDAAYFRQPLLDAVIAGVDGNGSQPLSTLLADQKALRWTLHVMSCAAAKFGIPPLIYPSFGFENADKSVADGGCDDVCDAAYSLVRVLQLVDYLYLKVDWSQIERFTNPPPDADELGASLLYWVGLLQQIDRAFVAPLFTCAGYPGVTYSTPSNTRHPEPGEGGLEKSKSAVLITSPSGPPPVPIAAITPVGADFKRRAPPQAATRRLGAELLLPTTSAPRKTQRSATKTARREKLKAAADSGRGGSIEQIAAELSGPGGADVLRTFSEILGQAETCDHPLCAWLRDKHGWAVHAVGSAVERIKEVVNVVGALFFIVANLGFVSYDVLLTFPSERATFTWETEKGLYSPLSYFVAKNLADLPFQLLPSLVLTAAYYALLGFGYSAASPWHQCIVYLVITSGVTFAAYGFGYLVSAASPRMELAVLIAPAILVTWLTLAGFFLRDEQIPQWIYWFGYMSFYKWGFFALVVSQVAHPSGGLPDRLVLLISGVTETNLRSLICTVYGLGFAFRCCAFLALKYTNRKRFCP